MERIRSTFLAGMLVACFLMISVNDSYSLPPGEGLPVAKTVLRSIGKISIPIQIVVSLAQTYECIQAYVKCKDEGGQVVWYSARDLLWRIPMGKLPFHCYRPSDEVAIAQGGDKLGGPANLEPGPPPYAGESPGVSSGASAVETDATPCLPEGAGLGLSQDESSDQDEAALGTWIALLLDQQMCGSCRSGVIVPEGTKIILVGECGPGDLSGTRLHDNWTGGSYQYGGGGSEESGDWQEDPVDYLPPSIYIGSTP
jgi:hypothetical protein